MDAQNAAEKALRKQAQQELEAQVKKELRRIKRFVREAEKRGYTFSENVIPTLPKSGITAGTLRKLQKKTPAALYKKASYTLPSGKRIRGVERKAQERSEAAKQGAITRKGYQILKTIRGMLADWAPDPRWTKPLAELKEEDKNLLERVLDGAIAELGERQVAINLHQHAKRAIELVEQVIYGDSGKRYVEGGRNRAQGFIVEFNAIVRNKALNVRESKEATEYGELTEDGETE